MTASLGAMLLAVAATAGEAKEPVTFTKDVMPLLQKHCQECHRPGQIAPMSLLSFEEVRPWAESIRENVSKGTMPPWHADPHYGTFANDRRLTDAEIATLVGWAEAGAPEGDPADLPPPLAFTEGWSIGEPDVVLAMQEEYEVPAEGADEYIYFSIPTNFDTDRYVEAVEILPGNAEVVHHVLAYVQPGGTGTLSRAQVDRYNKAVGLPFFFGEGDAIRVRADAPVHDNGCSVPNGGAALGGDMTSGRRKLLATFVPGARGDRWTEGRGKVIPAGSELLLQVHYNKTGEVERDRTSVGLVLSEGPLKHVVESQWVQNYYFRIPPGASSHEVTGCYTFERDVEFLAYFPHMHVRGKDMTIKAIYENGLAEILLSVPSYDFNWQTTYSLKEPKTIPKGTRILVTAHFDNSPGNAFNPDPKSEVRWGDPTTDEMMIGGIDFVAAATKSTEDQPDP
jgi:hypothetical protein